MPILRPGHLDPADFTLDQESQHPRVLHISSADLTLSPHPVLNLTPKSEPPMLKELPALITRVDLLHVFVTGNLYATREAINETSQTNHPELAKALTLAASIEYDIIECLIRARLGLQRAQQRNADLTEHWAEYTKTNPQTAEEIAYDEAAALEARNEDEHERAYIAKREAMQENTTWPAWIDTDGPDPAEIQEERNERAPLG